MLTTKFDIVW